jgi:hypothetical protein
MALIPTVQGVQMAAQAAGGVAQDLAAANAAGSTAQEQAVASGEFGAAANIAFQNSQEASAAGKLQQVQNARKVFQVSGAGIAAAAGNGERMSGSAMNILRNSHEQGTIAGQLIGTQTQIEVNGYIDQMNADFAQQQQADEMKKAAEEQKKGDFMGAIIHGVELVGAAVATVYTGGAAAPLLVAAGAQVAGDVAGGKAG